MSIDINQKFCYLSSIFLNTILYTLFQREINELRDSADVGQQLTSK